MKDPRPRRESAKPPAQSERKPKQVDQEERKALIRKEILEKCDLDKDGKLSPEENARMSNEDKRRNYMAMPDEEKAKVKKYIDAKKKANQKE